MWMKNGVHPDKLASSKWSGSTPQVYTNFEKNKTTTTKKKYSPYTVHLLERLYELLKWNNKKILKLFAM